MKVRDINAPLFQGSDSELRFLQIVSLVILAAGFLMPSDGLGFSVCLFYNFSGRPCPGCGLTRSVAALLHGEWGQALRYHAFGTMAVGGALLLAWSAFSWKAYRYILRRKRLMGRLLLGIAAAATLYGAARLFWLELNWPGAKFLFYPFQEEPAGPLFFRSGLLLGEIHLNDARIVFRALVAVLF